jgi:hypothetical protein
MKDLDSFPEKEVTKRRKSLRDLFLKPPETIWVNL